MGSVIVSEVAHDTTHFPRSSMLATPHAPAYQAAHHTTSSPATPAAAVASSHSLHTPSSVVSPASAARPPQHSDPQQHGSIEAATAEPHASQPAHDASSTAKPPVPSETPSAGQSSTSSAHSRSVPTSPERIKIKDLHHIQSFVEDEKSVPSLAATGQIPAERTQELPQYEISDMPVTDVIEMVAGLLTKITSTNDDQAERLHKDIPSPEYAAKMNPLSNGVLAFHGKNVPTISIMSYLTRIHKYCPATYEVFLSLLVYFDRITDKINESPASPFEVPDSNTSQRTQSADGSERTSRQQHGSFASDMREADRPSSKVANEPPPASGDAATSDYPSPPPSEPDPYSFANYFVVDSFNIHRLIIAGVTCASKFFSDVFYTNSRYAKVGGLPLPELNNLEVQFLLLNDFRLSIAVEELEAYGTMLVEFYAREVIAQKHDDQAEGPTEPSAQ